MAKLGEGDPRWIVADRADGRNVNSWHWTERDVSDWAKSRMTALIEEQSFHDAPSVKCKTLKIANLEGDCTVFNRKGKISFLLDMNFGVHWEGEVWDREGHSMGSCKGTFTVPEVEHDSDPERLNIEVTCSGSEESLFAPIVQTQGRALVRGKISTFLKELKDGHGVQEKKAGVEMNVGRKATETKTEVGQRVDYTCTLEWRVPPSNLWEALTHEGRVAAYTRSAAKLKAEVGGSFEMLNGTIRGTFVTVEALKKLEMQWRLSDWPENHYSAVTITLEPIDSSNTLMKLVQTDIPSSELERTKQGWQQNFWDPIKMLFGYGYDWKS